MKQNNGTRKSNKREINKAKRNVLNKLFNMMPYLETMKEDIVNECIKEKKEPKKKAIKKPTKNEIEGEIVFNEIEYKGEILYTDDYGSLWNDKAEIIGSVRYDDKGLPNYALFDSEFNIDI